MQKVKKSAGGGTVRSTEIGRLNRKIEESVSGVFKGDLRATGEAISYAKKREIFLTTNKMPKKMPA